MNQVVESKPQTWQCPRCKGHGHCMIQAAPGLYVNGECPICKGAGRLNQEPRPIFRGHELTEEQMKSMFCLAGFKILHHWPIQNRYWTGLVDNPHPWWLVRLKYGMVEIGFRKRVMSIDWTQTTLRHVVTEDRVTKDDVGVHAYSVPDAIKYLTTLRLFAEGRLGKLIVEYGKTIIDKETDAKQIARREVGFCGFGGYLEEAPDQEDAQGDGAVQGTPGAG